MSAPPNTTLSEKDADWPFGNRSCTSACDTGRSDGSPFITSATCWTNTTASWLAAEYAGIAQKKWR